jgi:hypothetical protein
LGDGLIFDLGLVIFDLRLPMIDCRSENKARCKKSKITNPKSKINPLPTVGLLCYPRGRRTGRHLVRGQD